MGTNMNVKSAFVILLVLLASFALHAEEQPSESKPRIRSDLESIMFFEGQWEGVLWITANDKTHEVGYFGEFKRAPNSKAIYLDELIVHPELGNLKRDGVLDYDEKTQKIRWMRKNYEGKIRVYYGSWVSQIHFQFEAGESLPTGEFREQIDFFYRDKNQLDVYQISTLDGKKVQRDSGYFSRK